MIDEITPHRHAQYGSDDISQNGFGLAQGCVNRTEQILNHEPSSTSTSVYSGEDEQRLEQNGKVIPEGFHPRSANHRRHDFCHANRQGGCAACPMQDGMFTDVFSGLSNHLWRDRPAPIGDDLRGFFYRVTNRCHRAVHGEIDTRIKYASCGQGHDRHERFGQHPAVTD